LQSSHAHILAWLFLFKSASKYGKNIRYHIRLAPL
jgi:hypothetical protein